MKDFEPINRSTPVVELEIGRRRPGFRHDAPRWFTVLVFGFFVGLILLAI